MSFLSIQQVNKDYTSQKGVVKDFTLQLEKGDILALLGESGSGKSTLLKMIAGLENKDTGEINVGDLKVKNPSERLVPGYDEVQLVYQDYKLYPNATVAENILRPLLLYDRSYRESRVRFLLDLLKLEAYKDKLPRHLSGGQQQKVAIGRALSLEPELILLDEPFSSLDTIQRRELLVELKSMFKALGVTVVFVTHDLDDALQLTDQLALIKQGVLIQRGTAAEIFKHPANLYAAQLFSHLNAIPEQTTSFIRPSDIKLFKTKGVKAKVMDVQYLIHYNQLFVQLANGHHWRLEDQSRSFQIGDSVYLQWEESKILHFNQSSSKA
ncbi:ABC transporter ATP-binding protein [Mongoliitalea daihaiensis]|uniref:ABC transporter ATP-binding protein n=1 Tax=Mongoliitalea daihaiensis TaxID=2782006 RepID=UPI001F19480D|nr:ABC transporter ATP-binding protein [Mongoliitalea daihaiensis]UJP63287.1 ABC transporter ATP-binding protein [Mongoliitalea daihaiensis]